MAISFLCVFKSAAYVCVYVYMYVHVYICKHVSAYTCVYTCMCICIFVCVYAFAHVCVCMCIPVFSYNPKKDEKVSHWMAPPPADCLGEETTYLQITWPVAKQTNRISHFGWDLEVPSPGLSPKEEIKMQS